MRAIAIVGICSSVFATEGAAAGHTAGAFSAELQPHRAVYDLSLNWASDRSGIEALDGRFVYSFSGGACTGYATDMRMVTDVAGADEMSVTDQVSSTYEDMIEGEFSFSSKLYTDFLLQSDSSGEASRTGSKVIELRHDDERSVELQNAQFPTEYLANLIDAAAAGKRVFEAVSFDGSGEKPMRAVTMIGGLSAEKLVLTSQENDMRSWHVTTAYFDIVTGAGDETPSYTVSMLLSENGISRDLLMDFGDFKISGKLRNLEVLDPVYCDTGDETAYSLH